MDDHLVQRLVGFFLRQSTGKMKRRSSGATPLFVVAFFFPHSFALVSLWSLCLVLLVCAFSQFFRIQNQFFVVLLFLLFPYQVFFFISTIFFIIYDNDAIYSMRLRLHCTQKMAFYGSSCSAAAASVAPKGHLCK